jgi:hypothetical protein
MLIPHSPSSSDKYRDIYEGVDIASPSSSKALMSGVIRNQTNIFGGQHSAPQGVSTRDDYGDEYHFGPAGNPRWDDAARFAEFEEERRRCLDLPDVPW